MLEIRKIIREIISERLDMGHFPEFYGYTKFPYRSKELEDEMEIFNRFAENQDLYSFPMEAFKLGIHLERKNNPEKNIMDCALDAIKNLKKDVKFYNIKGT